MKVVINTCFGGFSLSPEALRRWAELKGRECYFFVQEGGNFHTHVPVSIDQIGDRGFWYAFDIPNPDEVLPSNEHWHELSLEERQERNRLWGQHVINDRGIPRNDPDLIRVIEEMGAGHRTGASGRYSELTVVDIPDGVEYTIEEYDGNEHVAEKHRTWWGQADAPEPLVGGLLVLLKAVDRANYNLSAESDWRIFAWSQKSAIGRELKVMIAKLEELSDA